MRHPCALTAILMVAGTTAVAQNQPERVEPKPATTATNEANARMSEGLPFGDRDDFADAMRGFIDKPASLVIKTPDGGSVWNMDAYAFEQIDAPAPDTVNPSLWRNARLTTIYGLFKVVDNVYQVRGYDLSNISIIEGPEGLIVIDPLTAAETAKAAMDLYFKHRPKKPVAAVIYTHSHVDHYAGVRGVVADADVANVQIIAPEGFLEHAVSENVMAGNAMSRRAVYMYGALLPKAANGQVDAGLGKTNATGTVTLLAPGHDVEATGESMTIAGLEVVFQVTPDTEAPSEMNVFFPQLKALCAAENATHTLHNLYTLRGAQVRNGQAWANYLNEAIELFGDRSEVVFASHHWPTWGRERVVGYLEKQRDLYKFLHDQTLRLINEGYTGVEIANMLELPESLAHHWYNRGYYGTVSHDVRGIYQRYMGWYDGNPANLNALPPVEAGRKYVEFMGGAGAVVEKARASFEKGEYRWVAQVLNHVVFADPDGTRPETGEAKRLLADALEQLGYQAESGPWRNVYLSGAFELRNGVLRGGGGGSSSPDTLRAMTEPMIFDYMGVRLNGEKADGIATVINWSFTDIGKRYAMTLKHSALTYVPGKQAAKPDATIELERSALDELMLGEITPEEAIRSGRLKVSGNTAKVTELFSLLDDFSAYSSFNIVTP